MDAGLVKDTLRWVGVPLVWLSGRMNRQRLSGARVEIVVMLLARRPEPSVLMVRSVFDDFWMPPQEGVDLRESLLHALARGLREECRVDVLDGAGQLSRDFYLRNISYLDTLLLPADRRGERSVAGNVGDTVFSQITMTKKAYWVGYLVTQDRSRVHPTPNQREVLEARWMTFDEAAAAVGQNRQDKADLLMLALRTGLQHLSGARTADEWDPQV